MALGGFLEGTILFITALVLASPLTRTIYTRPRLWYRMTELCKEVSDTILPGVIVQFKRDKGHILSSEPGFALKEEVENYYIDVWLVRPRPLPPSDSSTIPTIEP